MGAFAQAVVLSLTEVRDDLVRARVSMGAGEANAVGFPAMLGPVAPGDRLVVNTTGIELQLGTGGVGFILWNLDGEGPPGPGPGHLIKLRYTPWQTEVDAIEAPESPHHEAMAQARSLDGMPVVAASLHSQVAGIVAGIKAARPRAKVGYLMTDGGALPLAWSDLVSDLKGAGLIDVTCTTGHAFGGDLEAVNVFSGLAALARVASVDATVVALGPGIVGSATALGFSGLEQGQVLDAVSALGGRSIACLRISFTDSRPRHRGVSHHTLTSLMIAARERTRVVVPSLDAERAAIVRSQLDEAGIYARHDVVEADGARGVQRLKEAGLEPSSMGRSLEEAPEPFLAGAAAGSIAALTIS
jgi:hypothetical protein